MACSTTATHGILTSPMADAMEVIEQEHSYFVIGPVEGRRCRYIFANVIPWGDSTPRAAMEVALEGTAGNALVNVSVTTSLYSFVPMLNVLALTCTTVDGIAVRID